MGFWGELHHYIKLGLRLDFIKCPTKRTVLKHFTTFFSTSSMDLKCNFSLSNKPMLRASFQGGFTPIKMRLGEGCVFYQSFLYTWRLYGKRLE